MPPINNRKARCNFLIFLCSSTKPEIISKGRDDLLKLKYEKIRCTPITIEGISDYLERYLEKKDEDNSSLPLLHDDKMVRTSIDIRVKARKDFYFTLEVETTQLMASKNFGLRSCTLHNITEVSIGAVA